MTVILRGALAGGLMALAVTDAFGQAAIEPGRVQQQFKPPPLPKSKPEIVVPEIPRDIAPTAAKSIKVTLSAINIVGSTVYPANSFADLTKPLIGREIPLSDVFKLADAITARYRNDYYLLSRAIVPAQRLDGGVLRIQVIEGYIHSVRIKGPKNALLEKYAAEIEAARPLRRVDLERNLLLANDLPGTVARAVLAPAQGITGASDLTLVTTEKPLDGFAGIDNRGTRYIGPDEAFVGARLNDPLGLGDKTTLLFSTAFPVRELQYFSLQEDLPLNADGLLLSLSGGYSNSFPGFVLKNLDPKAKGTSVGAKLSYPIIRSRETTWTVDASFSYLNSRIVLNGDPAIRPSTDDHIRVLRFGTSYDFADIYGGHNLIDAEYSQGIPMLNASENEEINPSRIGAKSYFQKLTADASRRQDLGSFIPNAGLYIALTAQTGFGNALYSAEQFGLGGAVFGRGYDPSEITGDDGVAGKLELQYNQDPGVLNATLQYYAFYDLGKAWSSISEGNALVETGNLHSASLASVGGGVRFDILKTVSGDLELAKPLTRGVQSEILTAKDPKPLRFYFELNIRF